MIFKKNFLSLVHLSIIALLCFPKTLSSQVLSLAEIRTEFPKAVKEEESCSGLYKKMLRGSDTSDAVWMAYHGTITATMAKYTLNPFRKLQYFKDGKILLEKSIAKDSKNIEIRFLRFTVQDHCPFFLDYHQELETDKKYILDNLQNASSPRLKKAIVNYIAESDRFSLEEKKWAVNLAKS